MYDYCSTCLSRNRYLTIPSEEIRILCTKIIPNYSLIGRSLCWECKKILQKVISFTRQAIQSANVLKSHLKDGSNIFLESKSRLRMTQVQIINIVPNIEDNLNPHKDVINSNTKKRYLQNACSYFSYENNNSTDKINILKGHKNDARDMKHKQNINSKLGSVKKQTKFEKPKLKTVDEVLREMMIEASNKNKNIKPIIEENQLNKEQCKLKTIEIVDETSPCNDNDTLSVSDISDNMSNDSSIVENEYKKYKIKYNNEPKIKPANERKFKTIDEIIKEMEYEKKLKNQMVEKETNIGNVTAEKNNLLDYNDNRNNNISVTEESQINKEVSNKTSGNDFKPTKNKMVVRRRLKKNNYYCKTCSKTFKTRGAYEYHKESHLEKKPYCDICKKAFVSKSVLWTHNNLQHKDVKSYTCEECKKVFFTLPGYETHIANHQQKQKIYFCEPCKKFFQNNSSFRRHLRVSKKHSNPLTWKYKCIECNRAFQTESDLSHHKDVIHLNINKFNCQLCPKKYCNRRALRLHIRTKHENFVTPKNIMCHLCGKVFRNNQVLKIHTKTHHAENKDVLKL